MTEERLRVALLVALRTTRQDVTSVALGAMVEQVSGERPRTGDVTRTLKALWREGRVRRVRVNDGPVAPHSNRTVRKCHLWGLPR